MAIERVSQTQFTQGEIGPFMLGRFDNKIYSAAAQTLENWLILPQGPILRRPGFQYVDTLAGAPTSVRTANFDFDTTQQYLLVFVQNSLVIYRNFTKVATLATTYLASELQDLRFTQSTDTMIITHQAHPVAQLVRGGSDTVWSLSAVVFVNPPFHRYNVFQVLTPSANTGTITLTLNGSLVYFTAAHIGTLVQLNGGTAIITAAAGLTATATVVTALTVAPTSVTTTQAVVTGDVSGTTLTVSAVTSGVLAIGQSLSSTSMSGGTVISALGTGVGGVGTYILSVSSTVTGETITASTTVFTPVADAAWKEQAFSTRHGFPRVAIFAQNRLILASTTDAPSTLWGGNVGDFFNHTPTTLISGIQQVTASDSFDFTLSTDAQHIIVNMFYMLDLIVFTNQGEFRATGGYLTPISSVNIQIIPQSNYGSASIPNFQIDLQVVYATQNLKELRGMSYQYVGDRFVSDNYTLLGHDLFQPNKAPISMCIVRSYADTQANYVFVARSDGQLACLCVNVSKEVEGWSRLKTQGKFLNVCTVATQNANGFTKDTLFAIVQRQNGVFVEAMTDLQDVQVYLDCWQTSTQSPTTSWGGLTQLDNQVIQIIGDGLVEAPVTVTATGSFTTSEPRSTVYAGLGYTSLMVPMPYSFNINNKLKRGLRMRKIQSFIIVYQTQALNIDGYDVPFRFIGGGLLDQPLPYVTGTVQQNLGGDGFSTDPIVTLTVTDPVACTVLALTVDLETRDE